MSLLEAISICQGTSWHFRRKSWSNHSDFHYLVNEDDYVVDSNGEEGMVLKAEDAAATDWVVIRPE